jgi:GTP-binding protein LepA
MNMYNQKNIRNFAIIAHVDHGKSTLSDRFIEMTNGIQSREMTNCVLDNMDLEKEKGITIKARCIRLEYEYNKENYILNLVDTPGHVDFQYEVEKSLSTVGLVILLIDATQGVASQTLSNFFLATKNPNIKIIIAINKIDSINSNVEMCKKQIETILKLNLDEIKIFYISARAGTGVKELLEKGIIESNKYPEGNIQNPLQTLIFDSWYDNYLGIIALIYINEGVLQKKDLLITKFNSVKIEANKFGYMKDKMVEVEELKAGEIGYLVTNIKEPNVIRIGDTLINSKDNLDALPGFKASVPVVFCSLYLDDPDKFYDAQKNLEKLHLNDSSFFFEPERSTILGMGFKCGFLGLLHMEIILERLLREYGLEFIVTIPNVTYRIKKRGDENYTYINNAIDLPTQDKLEVTEEQIVLMSLLTTEEYIGTVKNLCFSKRGIYEDEIYMDGKILLTFHMPLGEIILDFQDQIKSLTSGYSSYGYEFIGYQPSSLVRLDFIINDQLLEELSCIIHKSQGEKMARQRCIKLKENLPRGQVEIKIQGSINGKIIAGERIAPYRKDVIAKCYGGDVSRKNKLLDKQKKGKKNLNREITIPPNIFVKILKF